MQDERGVPHDALCVALGSAKGPVMHAQFRQHLAGSESEILDEKIALRRKGIVGRVNGTGREQQKEK